MEATQSAVNPTAAVQTAGIWFGAADRPALGWLSHRAGESSSSGVIVLPPLGYPYWCSHRPLRGLSERIASLGHTVLRIDYDGTGDSAGDQWDPGRLQAWRATVHEAAGELRRGGARQLTLVGARLGATFALLDGRELGAERIVAWSPVVKGRRYAKEIMLLSQEVPVDQELRGRSGTRVVAGNVFADETIRELGTLSLDAINAPPARSVLLIDDDRNSCAAVAERLVALDTQVEHLQIADSAEVLETPPEYMHPYEHIVDPIAGWLGPAEIDRSTTPLLSPPRAATFDWRGQQLEEEVITVGVRRHVAIVTRPSEPDPEATTLVLLNPGSETHVGPGRVWVEAARELAAFGRQTIRVDFIGWGESADALAVPGHPYDPSCVADTLQIVDALRADGYRRLAICGLCASAWIALDAARVGSVDGVIAINPQLYWKQGDPVEIDWDLIRARRADEIQRVEQGARNHLWTALDILGDRSRVRRWLDWLVAGDCAVELIFAERDDGLKYLRERYGRRLSKLTDDGSIGLQVLTEVDHPMHMTWLRPRVMQALARSLSRIDGSGSA